MGWWFLSKHLSRLMIHGPRCKFRLILCTMFSALTEALWYYLFVFRYINVYLFECLDMRSDYSERMQKQAACSSENAVTAGHAVVWFTCGWDCINSFLSNVGVWFMQSLNKWSKSNIISFTNMLLFQGFCIEFKIC